LEGITVDGINLGHRTVRDHRHGDLSKTAPGESRSGFTRRADRNTIQPSTDGFARLDIAGSAGQHVECRLERVLGKMLVATHAPTDGQDHGPMPVHQGREGILVPMRDEPIQKTTIRDDRLRYAAEGAALDRGHECREDDVGHSAFLAQRTDANDALLAARPRFRVNHHGSRRVLAGNRPARRWKKPKNHE
jgi:hypothetical protein